MRLPALAFLVAALAAPAAHAQPLQLVPTELTSREALDLYTALLAFDTGVIEQCDQAKLPKDTKPADLRPCAYIRSPKLTIASAQDQAILKPTVLGLQLAQNTALEGAIEAAVKGCDQTGIEAGSTDVANKARADAIARVCANADAAREPKFAVKSDEILAQAPALKLGLMHINMSDLDMGEPPAHNRISSKTLAGLLKIVDTDPAK